MVQHLRIAMRPLPLRNPLLKNLRLQMSSFKKLLATTQHPLLTPMLLKKQPRSRRWDGLGVWPR